jgi:hypothetical protein
MRNMVVVSSLLLNMATTLDGAVILPAYVATHAPNIPNRPRRPDDPQAVAHNLALMASHTDTLGALAFHITAAGADPLNFAAVAANAWAGR